MNHRVREYVDRVFVIWNVGCVPEKQNHYRTTGQVIMMERDWGCFENDYSKRRITAASTLWTL